MESVLEERPKTKEEKEKEEISSRQSMLIQKEKEAGQEGVHRRVKILHTQELLDVQKRENPNPYAKKPGDEYVVLLLSKLQELWFRASIEAPDDTFQVTVDMLSLDSSVSYEKRNIEKWRKYKDKEIDLSITPLEGCLPSDTSLPLGMPRLSSSKVIK